jgi:hypothetical protein
MRKVVDEVPQGKTRIKNLQKGFFFIYLRIVMSKGSSGVLQRNERI